MNWADRGKLNMIYRSYIDIICETSEDCSEKEMGASTEGRHKLFTWERAEDCSEHKMGARTEEEEQNIHLRNIKGLL